MDVWAWICDLPNSSQWTESDPPQVFQLATTESETNDTSSPTRSIQLRAERASDSSASSITFTICLHGFDDCHVSNGHTLWTSDTCHLSADKPFLRLVLQLLQETISRAPTAHDSTSPRCPRSQLQKLKPDVLAWIMDSHSPESFSAFFAVALLARLFWLLAAGAPADAGEFFFRRLLAPAAAGLGSNSPAMRTFFATAGVDAELCFVRAVGYMLTKWCIFRDTAAVGLQILTPKAPQNNCGGPGGLGFFYATEAHGFWTLKGYAPMAGMKLARGSVICGGRGCTTNDLVLRYALAHQQLEAVIQLEYTVGFYESLIQVNARVDNIRLHVVKLGYNKGNNKDNVDVIDEEAVEFDEERHFPTRVRVWVGPEVGANYVSGLSLGQSTDSSDHAEAVLRKSKARTRTRQKSWRWDQDAEGNAAVFEGVLCEKATGREVMGGGAREGSRGRYEGAERAFTKSGGVVMAGDEYGEGVGWRISKEMEGSVLKWRIGGKVWVSYLPNRVNNVTSCFETRCVEWCDEVDLPLIPAKLLAF